MNSTNYLIFNDLNICIGSGFTPDGTVPENARTCTESQVDHWQNSILVGDDIVNLPPPKPTPEQLQDQANAEARAYLDSTDWYVTRFAETGVPIPADIAEARKLARESVK